jgi:protein involved in polysaccharide export with SLBB domain
MLRKFLSLVFLLSLAAGPRLLAQQQRVLRAEAVQAAAPASSPEGAVVPLRSGDEVMVRIANVPADDQSQINGGYTLD